jgi:hypothetical protein
MEPKTMITQPTAIEPEKETPEQSKARRNAEYLAKIDRAIRDLDEGRGITVTMEELEAMANE